MGVLHYDFSIGHFFKQPFFVTCKSLQIVFSYTSLEMFETVTVKLRQKSFHLLLDLNIRKCFLNVRFLF